MGIITQFELTNPVSVWIPNVTNTDFKGTISKPRVDALNAAINKQARETVQTYADLSKAMNQTASINPMLPMGTYVSVKYNMYAPSVLELITGLNSIQAIGINYFIFAITEVMVKLDLLAKRE